MDVRSEARDGRDPIFPRTKCALDTVVYPFATHLLQLSLNACIYLICTSPLETRKREIFSNGRATLSVSTWDDGDDNSN